MFSSAGSSSMLCLSGCSPWTGCFCVSVFLVLFATLSSTPDWGDRLEDAHSCIEVSAEYSFVVFGLSRTFRDFVGLFSESGTVSRVFVSRA